MARRKTISDDALLDLLLASLPAGGPAALTFAAAAASSKLSAATLVQRFGTREAMVEAMLVRAWDRLDESTRAADERASNDVCGAVELLLELMPEDSVEHAIGDGLLLLHEDFRNPVLRARGAAWGTVLARALGRRLHADKAEGVRLGWQLARVWQGALVWWAFTREGAPRTAMKNALEDWLRTAGY